MSAGAGDARIGPNAIVRVAEALEAMAGQEAARRVFAAAGLSGYLEAPPDAMVAEREVIALHASLRRTLSSEAARDVSRRAGRATGDYLLRHRIPRPVQWVLRHLPRRLAAKALLSAITRHAWTFAGSGTLVVDARTPMSATLHDCPICRGARADAPACEYYRATFERLFSQLVDARAAVTETHCAAQGGDRCRFEIRLG